MATGQITGLVVDAGAVTSSDDDDDMTEVERLLYRALTRLKQKHHKAAMAAMVEATNMLAHEHSINGGAWL